MWILIPNGFLSAVQNELDPTGETLQVRGRAKADLEFVRDWALAEHAVELEIVSWPGRDYPWRVIMSKDVLGSFLVDMVEKIDYTNFKGEVATINPHRAKVYGQLWTTLTAISIEDGSPAPYSTGKISIGAAYTIDREFPSRYDLDLVDVIDEAGDDIEVPIWDELRQCAVGYRSLHSLSDVEWLEYDATGVITEIDDEPQPKIKKKKKGKGPGGRR